MSAEHERLMKHEAALRRLAEQLIANVGNYREAKLPDGITVTAFEKRGILTLAIRNSGALAAAIHWRLQPDVEDYVINPDLFDADLPVLYSAAAILGEGGLL